MKRVLCIILALVLCVGMVPTTAFAATGENIRDETAAVDQSTGGDQSTDGEQADGDVQPNGETADGKQAAGSEQTNDDKQANDDKQTIGGEQDPESQTDTKEYADVSEFEAAIDKIGDATDEASTRAVIAECLAIYARLSPEDQAAQAEAYAYIKSYAEDLGQSEIDPLALLTHEKFSIQVNIGYLDGDLFVITGSKTVIGTCQDGTGHAGFNHTMSPGEILREAGYPESTNYRVTRYSYWDSPASTTRVTYNITGSAPYKADQTFWIIGDKPSTDPGTPPGGGNGGGVMVMVMRISARDQTIAGPRLSYTMRTIRAIKTPK